MLYNNFKGNRCIPMTPISLGTTAQAAMTDIPIPYAPTTANTPNRQQIMITAKRVPGKKGNTETIFTDSRYHYTDPIGLPSTC